MPHFLHELGNLALIAASAAAFLNLGVVVLRLVVVRPHIERGYPIGDYFADYVMLTVVALLAGAAFVGYGVYTWLP